MNNYIAIFREPDGRTDTHTPDEIARHREHWAAWWGKWSATENLSSGSALTLEGCLITGDGSTILNQIHRVGTEIVGGFLMLRAESLEEATQIAASCPIYEFGGYAEVREFQKQ
jgi:hypothetical protein